MKKLLPNFKGLGTRKECVNLLVKCWLSVYFSSYES